MKHTQWYLLFYFKIKNKYKGRALNSEHNQLIFSEILITIEFYTY